MQTVEELHQHYKAVRQRLMNQTVKKKIDHVCLEAANDEPQQKRKHLSPAQQVIFDVAEKHGVTVEEILGPCRKRKFVRARQEAMYLLRETGKYTLPQIGRFMKRDHTTVLFAHRLVKKALGATRATKGKVSFTVATQQGG